MDKSTKEEHISQSSQTNFKHSEMAVTFLCGYNGIFKITHKKDKFFFISVFEGAEYKILHIPPGAYELESSNAENKRIIIDEG